MIFMDEKELGRGLVRMLTCPEQGGITSQSEYPHVEQ